MKADRFFHLLNFTVNILALLIIATCFAAGLSGTEDAYLVGFLLLFFLGVYQLVNALHGGLLFNDVFRFMYGGLLVTSLIAHSAVAALVAYWFSHAQSGKLADLFATLYFFQFAIIGFSAMALYTYHIWRVYCRKENLLRSFV